MPLYTAITEDGFVFDETKAKIAKPWVVTGDTSDNDEATAFPGLAAANLI